MVWQGIQPLVLYPLLAAALLVCVSLLAGWLQSDLAALFRRRGLFVLCSSVACALFIYLAGAPTGDAAQATFGEGLSRLPLYLLALAYGPSVGLLGGGLFAMLSLMFVAGNSLGMFELLLLLELLVLGWLASSPSIFRVRWAAALNIPFACLLAWTTLGTALLQSGGANARLVVTHWQYHHQALWAIYWVSLAISLLPPETYRQLFRGSSLLTQPQTRPASKLPIFSSAIIARRRLKPLAPRLIKHSEPRRHERSPTPTVVPQPQRKERERSLEPVTLADL